MSYTRPDADAVDFAFTGAAYTRPAANAVNFAFGEEDPPPDPDPVLLKAWSGSAWVAATAKRWDGSTWAAAFVRCWDGAAWVPSLLGGVISETGDSIVSESGDRLVLE